MGCRRYGGGMNELLRRRYIGENIRLHTYIRGSLYIDFPKLLVSQHTCKILMYIRTKPTTAWNPTYVSGTHPTWVTMHHNTTGTVRSNAGSRDSDFYGWVFSDKVLPAVVAVSYGTNTATNVTFQSPLSAQTDSYKSGISVLETEKSINRLTFKSVDLLVAEIKNKNNRVIHRFVPAQRGLDTGIYDEITHEFTMKTNEVGDYAVSTYIYNYFNGM